jgi:drug/metabolite transporter (DMT)-like permease
MVFFLKPFLAALFAWIVLNENLTVPMLLGGLFILGGMLAALVHVPQKRSLLKRTG